MHLSGWAGSVVNAFFREGAHSVAEATGTPWAFITALSVIAGWALAGPIFRFSDTWQLVINTARPLSPS
jgi:low affinity Fe/Cu permease